MKMDYRPLFAIFLFGVLSGSFFMAVMFQGHWDKETLLLTALFSCLLVFVLLARFRRHEAYYSVEELREPWGRRIFGAGLIGSALSFKFNASGLKQVFSEEMIAANISLLLSLGILCLGVMGALMIFYKNEA